VVVDGLVAVVHQEDAEEHHGDSDGRHLLVLLADVVTDGEGDDAYENTVRGLE
jgi:hypothetical protein